MYALIFIQYIFINLYVHQFFFIIVYKKKYIILRSKFLFLLYKIWAASWLPLLHKRNKMLSTFKHIKIFTTITSYEHISTVNYLDISSTATDNARESACEPPNCLSTIMPISPKLANFFICNTENNVNWK